jgi:hypothetical protein
VTLAIAMFAVSSGSVLGRPSALGGLTRPRGAATGAAPRAGVSVVQPACIARVSIAAHHTPGTAVTKLAVGPTPPAATAGPAPPRMRTTALHRAHPRRSAPRARHLIPTAAADDNAADAGLVDVNTGADVEGGKSDSSSSFQNSVWYGRALLIFVAAAYGSLSVAFKFVYSMPGPPSAVGTTSYCNARTRLHQYFKPSCIEPRGMFVCLCLSVCVCLSE